MCALVQVRVVELRLRDDAEIMDCTFAISAQSKGTVRKRRNVSLLAILLVRDEAVGLECRDCGCALVCIAVSLDAIAISRIDADAGRKVRSSVSVPRKGKPVKEESVSMLMEV